MDSGVPQGSHLGSTFSIMFINDLPYYMGSINILLFADDTNMFAIVNNAQITDLIGV